MSMSGLNLWASTAASIASFQSSTVISSGTSWPLLEYSRKSLPTSVRVSIERKTSPQGQWKKRGIVPRVLPCVPLPLPGAPKRMKVLYFMGSSRYTANSSKPEGRKPDPGTKKVRNENLFGHDRIDVHASPCAIETDVPINQRKNRVVAPEPYVFARQKFRAALADDDVAGDDHLAAKFFHAEPFANAVTAILDAALSFF